MSFVRRAPMLILAVAFASGIVLCRHATSSLCGSFLWGALGLGLALSAWRLTHPHLWQGNKQELTQNLFLWLLVLGLGVYRAQLASVPKPGWSLDEVAHCQSVRFEVVVDGPITSYPYGRRAWATVVQLSIDTTWQLADGRVILALPAQDTTSFAQYDTVYVSGQIRPLAIASEGYRTYLSQKGIHHQLFSRQLIRGHPQMGLAAFAHHLQAYFSQQLHGLIPDTAVSPVARAMLLGDRTDLDRAWKKRFAQVGISHILAISGLHIGIIFLCLDKLLYFLMWVPRGKQLKQLIILLALLGFMLISGASPAVVRATMMFSAILLFRLVRRRYYTLNVVALAAMIQLGWQPNLLFDLGFQLSYSAVMALVTVYPWFYQHFSVRKWWVDSLVSALGVTIVATLATLPLILVTFGQFPTFFLITNLLVGPLAFIAVFSGFLTLICCWIPGLNSLLALICTWAIQGMMSVADFLGNHPAALLTPESWAGWPWLLIQLTLTAVFLAGVAWYRAKIQAPL